ncbi:MAG: 4Fe-4S cluster-binding domain-containing protein [Leptospiraceae bacterium]|nr:4Fe-4S cluster-binding domain-containing protein [Leptospiraceae bacterium]MCP5513122.1 4Fe-4S cluster-binding domain-containing protein [Leptospiraceae bacterium]
METRVTEVFYSISGEGISQGIPTVFVRMAGCGLRCGKTENGKLWCDTEYSLSPNSGELLDLHTLLKKIESLSPQPTQVILTGGEPLEGKNRDMTISLGIQLAERRKKDEFPLPRIETNGKESIRAIDHAVFTLDYKLPGSGMEKHMNRENFDILNHRKNPLDEIKFVVRNHQDFTRAIEIISEWKLEDCNLIFSPVYGEMDAAELAEWVKSSHLKNSRLSLQLHKILWGNQRGV